MEEKEWTGTAWTEEEEDLRRKLDVMIDRMHDLIQGSGVNMLINLELKGQGWGARFFAKSDRVPARMILATELMEVGEERFFHRIFPALKNSRIVAMMEKDVEAAELTAKTQGLKIVTLEPES